MTDLTTRHVRANGIDIHCTETGHGPPLVLLHGGMVSTAPIWAGCPVAYVSHVAAFAKHFRVISPDTRGSGRTVHPGGPITYDLLADDVAGLIDALELKRPRLCGFSDGGTIATVAGIRHPERIGAIVNHAGFDMFEPQAKVFAMGRQVFGGHPEANQADPAAAERFLGSSPEMKQVFDLMKRDQDAGGPGWQSYLGMAFARFTRSPGYTFEKLRETTVPTLILVGDRDMFCSVEVATTAFRSLPDGELGILPGVGHFISPSATEATIEYLLRRAG